MATLCSAVTAHLAVHACACILAGSCCLCFAQIDSPRSGRLPLSPALVEIPGSTTIKPSYTTVEWDGKQYREIEGTDVLLKVAMEPVVDRDLRAKALHRLARFRKRELTSQLLTLYTSLEGTDEKVGVIQCLIASQDERGFPLFAQVLESDADDVVRLFAAVGFMQWNVRSGVAELMRLLENCKDTASSNREVCNEVAKEFLWFNAHKGWGFAEKETRESIMEKTDLDDNAKSALFVTEIKKWWAENEQRFPDWKPRDPLPASDGEDSPTPIVP